MEVLLCKTWKMQKHMVLREIEARDRKNYKQMNEITITETEQKQYAYG